MAHETFEESKILSEIELSYLPSQKFYNEIKIEHKDLTNYSTHCDSIKLKDYEEEVKGICKKYLRYLEKSPLWYISNSEFDVCKLLNYWIYDTLTNIFGDKNTSERIGFAFSTLQYIWEYTVNNRYIRTYYKNCKPDYDIVKHPDWKKRKELYEYYVDYTTIKGISDINMSMCKSYYEYIKKKAKLYEHFEKESSSSDYISPEFYSKSMKYIPKNVLHTLQCHSQISVDRDEEHKHTSKGESLHTEAEPGLGARKDSPGLLHLAHNLQNEVSTTETSRFGTKVTHSVLGAAPVLLTATALYKYTPLGSWIRRIGGGRTNSMNAMDTFLPYAQEKGDMFSEHSTNYISYQPI